MEEKKKWYESKTIWSNFGQFAIVIFSLFGVTVTEAEISPIMVLIPATIMFVVNLWGRLGAKKAIK